MSKAKQTDNDSKKSMETPRLEVRGKTLVFDNSIYQIRNVSAFEVGALKKQFPWASLLIPLLLAGGVYFVGYGYGLIPSLFVFVLVVAVIFFIWRNDKEYGLIIRLNSGFTQLIISRDMDFLKNIATVLQGVMNSEKEESLTFNLDQRTIVDNVSGSTVVMGNATGDVVNRISN